jgi:hypothetical protein
LCFRFLGASAQHYKRMLCRLHNHCRRGCTAFNTITFCSCFPSGIFLKERSILCVCFIQCFFL